MRQEITTHIHRMALLGLSLATLTFTTIASSAPANNLTLGSTNMTSSHFVVSNAMVKAISEGMPNITVTHVETGASVDNIRRLAKQELDLGLVATDAAIQALTGTGTFKNKQVYDIVALYSYDVSVLNIAIIEASS